MPGFVSVSQHKLKDGFYHAKRRLYIPEIHEKYGAFFGYKHYNWGLVGLFSFDLVAWLFGGSGEILSRIVYTVIALAGIWCVSLLFRSDHEHVALTD